MRKFHLIVLMVMVVGGAGAREIYVPDDYATIQDAIDISVTGDEIIVRDGEYSGEGFMDMTNGGKGITVRSESGPAHCAINGKDYAGHDGFVFTPGDGAQAVLEGFTFKEFSTHLNLIGVLSTTSPVLIKNCVFRKNFSGEGGAISVHRSENVIITQCEFIRNRAGDYGGAVQVDNSGVSLYTNRFFENKSGCDGGAVNFDQAHGTITNCVFDSNKNWGRLSRAADTYGGGLCVWQSAVTVINCLFVNNEVEGYNLGPDNYGWAWAGGAFFENGFCERPNLMINCTFYGNRAVSYYEMTDNGVAVTNNTDAARPIDSAWGRFDGIEFVYEFVLRNCLIWQNGNSDFQGAPRPDMLYSVLSTGFYDFGVGNNGDDPMFVSPETGLFYLSPESPCIDSGWRESSEVCFHYDESTMICLSDLTTQESGEPDTGISDRGYHYPIPTTATPTPVCPELRVTIEMPATTFHSGDACSCTAYVCNNRSRALENYPLFVILDVYGELFFGPGFTTAFDNYLSRYPKFAVGRTEVEVIPEFIWPEVDESASGIVWYAALLNPEMTDIVGEYGTFSFGWSAN